MPMNKNNSLANMWSELFNIPMDVIARGRDEDDVLNQYISAWEKIETLASKSDELTAEFLADANIFGKLMRISAYRIYLLGVEDGMKKEGEK